MPDADRPADAHVVARERELDAILRIAENARTEGGTVFVAGAPGLGKTTLIGLVCSRLHGWTIVRTHADSFESDLSYSTVDALMSGLSGVPGMRPKPRDPGANAIAVGRRLLDTLDGPATPLCIVIDDVQWVDTASARALRFVIRRLHRQPVLLIAAGRPGVGDLADALTALATSAPTRSLRCELAPFTIEQAQSLALARLGRNVSRRTAERLVTMTDGSPLLLTMVLRHAGSSIRQALHPADVEVTLPVAYPLASSAAAALAGADASARSAAEIIAVLRDPTPIAVFATIAETLGETTDVDTARALGLIDTAQRGGLTMVEPAHAMMADAIGAQLTLRRRRAIHRTAAAVLTGHRALRHRIEASERADPDLIDELMAASHDAAELGHADQAMSYARSAVQLTVAGPDRERCLLSVGILAMRTRQQERIFDLMPELQRLPQSAVRDVVLAELLTLTGNIAEGLERARAAVDSPGADPDARAVRAHAAGDIPMILLAARDFQPVVDQVRAARRLLDAAPRSGTEVSNPSLRWMVNPEQNLLRLLGWQLSAARYSGDPQLLRETMAELDSLLRSAADSPAVIDALVSQAAALVAAGDFDTARNGLARANQLIRRFPNSWTAGLARAIYGHVLFLLGEWDESVMVADTAVAFALDETDLASWPVAVRVASLVRAARGERDAVTEYLRSAAEAPHRGPASPYDPDLETIVNAELARALGSATDQLAAAEARTPASGWTRGPLTYRIDALARLGRAAEARELLAECTEPGSLWLPSYGSLAWLQGRVAEAEGDPAQAALWYGRACAEPAAAQHPFPLAIAQFDHARLLAASGRGAEAVAALTAAAATFRRLGAAPYLARCDAELQRLRVKNSAHPGAEAESERQGVDPFAELTTRERQVAHAIATGLTNREVADLLYVSVTTVNFHVRNILGKLGIPSRRELRRISAAAGAGLSSATAHYRSRPTGAVKN
ncbi:MAG: helix-turn-helix transcriptional regulator [Microbacteriaceae bacterium]|nr:MAG: helix-turn-helix transcriptional regulator [Microbacteriaceae bacterium]